MAGDTETVIPQADAAFASERGDQAIVPSGAHRDRRSQLLPPMRVGQGDEGDDNRVEGLRVHAQDLM